MPEINSHLTAVCELFKQQLSSRSPTSGVAVAEYDGTFDKDGVGLLSIKPPAVVLTCTGATPNARALGEPVHGSLGYPAQTQAAATFHLRGDFAAGVLAKTTGAAKRAAQAWEITEAAAGLLLANFAPRDLRARNMYSAALFKRGLFLITLSWSHMFEVAPDAAERFRPGETRLEDERGEIIA